MTKEITKFIFSTEYGYLSKTDLEELIKIDAAYTIEEAKNRGDYVRDVFFSAEQIDKAKSVIDGIVQAC